ncbi:hypothetical protein SAMN05421640_2037 [Ekhidna lutea]|uniref:Glycosyltransferase 2-like domain-containing protein n=1 Tax=Ekhidna lutea TaxID=447679 RepID=A0A239J846_EKHLU|nr:glycosyltransferase family 2 protein [Ekhidna lutea]SNT02061.1 hypothetical protein SAMN05421640_2037 [Ekhidna lutea]
MQIELDLSIVIINYNTNELTRDCIASIKENNHSLNYEIIVIDNSSQKEDPEDIKAAYPEINLITSDENLGFGRANNIGIKISKGKYILLLNSDTIILDDCLSNCLEFMKSEHAKSNNIGLIGCKVLNEDRTHQPSIFRDHDPLTYFLTSNLVLSHLSISRNAFDFEKTQIVSGVSGCFMMFDSSVFKHIKPFDPDFFMYAEESELCRNRVSKKFRICYFSNASIIHLGGQSSPTSKARFQNMLSYALYRYKLGTGDYFLYLIATLLNVLTLLIFLPILILTKKKSRIYELKGYFLILPYLLLYIPKYSRKWGGRESPLKFHK